MGFLAYMLRRVGAALACEVWEKGMRNGSFFSGVRGEAEKTVG